VVTLCSFSSIIYSRTVRDSSYPAVSKSEDRHIDREEREIERK